METKSRYNRAGGRADTVRTGTDIYRHADMTKLIGALRSAFQTCLKYCNERSDTEKFILDSTYKWHMRNRWYTPHFKLVRIHI